MDKAACTEFLVLTLQRGYQPEILYLSSYLTSHSVLSLELGKNKELSNLNTLTMAPSSEEDEAAPPEVAPADTTVFSSIRHLCCPEYVIPLPQEEQCYELKDDCFHECVIGE